MAATARDKLIKEIQIRLGAGIIDNELDAEHFDYAVTVAIDRYRQRSGNSLEESFVFLQIQPEVSIYTLPNEIQEIRDVYRRGIGGTSGGGAAVDPFSLAFTNNMYMLQNPGNMSGGGSGTLATYDFAMQYQELVGRMFGRDVMFTWDPATRKITFHRKFSAGEEVCLHAYLMRPEEILLNDPYSKPWLRDYSVAVCKQIMGEARSKFQSLAGPQGGISLNGDALKQEAKEEMDRLEEEIKMIIDGHEGYGFVIG